MLPMLSHAASTDSWHLPISVNAGAATGSTSSAMPILSASIPTRTTLSSVRANGSIATMSLTRLQCRCAVRPISDRADCWRRARRLASCPAVYKRDSQLPDCNRLSADGPRSNARAGEQHSAQLLRRPERHRRNAGEQSLWSYSQLRPLPFAQIRSGPAARLLPSDGHFDPRLQPGELEARFSLETADQGPGTRR